MKTKQIDSKIEFSLADYFKTETKTYLLKSEEIELAVVKTITKDDDEALWEETIVFTEGVGGGEVNIEDYFSGEELKRVNEIVESLE